MRASLLDRDTSAVVVIDVQEKLLPVIHDRDRVLKRIELLLEAARTVRVPVIVTEQYPKGLGGTVASVRKAVPECAPIEKTGFSCALAPGFIDRLSGLNRGQIVLAGMEAHVCVAQTAIDLVGRGSNVYVVADGTGSRRPLDATTALNRMAAAGVVVTTVEAVVFEWLRRAGTPEFKSLQHKLKDLS